MDRLLAAGARPPLGALSEHCGSSLAGGVLGRFAGYSEPIGGGVTSRRAAIDVCAATAGVQLAADSQGALFICVGTCTPDQ